MFPLPPAQPWSGTAGQTGWSWDTRSAVMCLGKVTSWLARRWESQNFPIIWISRAHFFVRVCTTEFCISIKQVHMFIWCHHSDGSLFAQVDSDFVAVSGGSCSGERSGCDRLHWWEAGGARGRNHRRSRLCSDAGHCR